MKYIVILILTIFTISYSWSLTGSDKKSTLFATKVVVDKSERKLYIYNGNKIIADYHIALGKNPIGPKRVQGDRKTPEGKYILDFKKVNSDYYRAIHVSYPSKKDIQYAKKLGKSPGGAIMIHGQPNGWGWLSIVRQRFDWTSGCIAVSNGDMDEIWRMVKPGTPILIKE